MRVLLITHYYPEHHGGVEIVAGELVKRLVQRDVQIVWAASGPTEAHDRDSLNYLPMRTWNFAERRLGFPYPLWSLNSMRKLRREIKRCDVVHVHDSLYFGNVAAYLWARRYGKPVVVTQHIGLVPYSSWLLRTMMYMANQSLARLLLSGCNQSVFISQKVLDYFNQFVAFRRSPPLFVPNGVATEQFRPVANEERHRLRSEFGWPDDKLVLLFVGRFVEKKGLPFLRKLAEQLTEVEWVFIGWGPHDPVQWHLPNVRCVGALPQSEIVAHYQAADVLVLPSVGEGFPLVVQEAMACGTPAIISTDTAGGAPGIEQAAYVADLQEDAWVALLRELLNSPDALENRRAHVAEFAHHHWNWESCADLYLNMFRQLLGEKGKARQEATVTVT